MKYIVVYTCDAQHAKNTLQVHNVAGAQLIHVENAHDVDECDGFLFTCDNFGNVEYEGECVSDYFVDFATGELCII